MTERTDEPAPEGDEPGDFPPAEEDAINEEAELVPPDY